ncbi:RNA polymerase sigma factor [Pseudalkalibacillus caeni]|uniref:RNA polymerase sigma factor n=1 Tax=Exobacillus caeni TaxID=2574798 RepID=A0A5R9F0Y8_9BACL|nr:RNA polymerase sigma factor [Pseudalkalibacillus caeni]
MNFSEIYSQFNKRLFSICYSIIRDNHLAEDAVQETFIKAFKNVKTIEEECKICAWLSSIATRTAIDILRREKRKRGIVMEHEMLEFLGIEMIHNVEQEAEAELLKEQIEENLKRLKAEHQEVLILKIRKGLKEDEIAKVLQLNPRTVKSRFYRARKQLKLLYQEQNTA